MSAFRPARVPRPRAFTSPTRWAVVATVAVSAAACGGAESSSGSSSTKGAGGEGAGGEGAGGAAGVGTGVAQGSPGGGPVGSCGATCGDGEFCSAANECIAEGTCAANADCTEAGTVCDVAKAACIPGGECGAEELQAAIVAPNMLIALDRSCSMTALVGGKSKWAIASGALQTLTATYADSIRFGLTLFPDLEGDSCKQGAIPIPVGDDKSKAIQALLDGAKDKSDALFPNGPCVTNIDTGVAQAEDKEPALKDAKRANYVMLVTDGKQSSSCGGNAGDARTLQSIKNLKAAGVSTYVVGFGAASDFGALDSFAEAGGTAVSGAHKYYLAENEAALQAAFTDIAKKSLSCTLELAKVPPDSTSIYVFFDDAPIPRDPSKKTGWEYDPAKNQVVFYGQACTDLKSGDVQDVDVVFGCAAPTPN